MSWIGEDECEAIIMRQECNLVARIRRILARDSDTIARKKPFKHCITVDGFTVVVYAPNVVTSPAGERTAIWASLYLDPRAKRFWRQNTECLVPIGSEF